MGVRLIILRIKKENTNFCGGYFPKLIINSKFWACEIGSFPLNRGKLAGMVA